jgi:type III secretion system-like peptide-binding chaperone
MRRTITLLCVALLGGFAMECAAAQTDDTLETLLYFRKCSLSAELQAVYERPAEVEGRARFLTITVTDRPAAFVQCRVAGGAVICEASAFDGGTELSKIPLPPQSVAALQKLGFAAAPDGKNLTYRRAFRGKPDFDAIAVLMLIALYDAYGVREETELKTYAPFAGYLVTACRR